jgi:hypothetical protein
MFYLASKAIHSWVWLSPFQHIQKARGQVVLEDMQVKGFNILHIALCQKCHPLTSPFQLY